MNLIKTLILIALLYGNAYHSSAQKLFIQPYIGAGTTGVTGDGFSNRLSKNIIAYTGGVNAGVSFGRLDISSGVALLTRGHKWERLAFANAYDPATGKPINDSLVDIAIAHKHILVPVTAGFAVVKSEKFSITPHGGVDLAFNISSNSTWKYLYDGHEVKTSLNAQGNIFPQVSLLAHISVMFAYNINQYIAITVAPVYYHHVLPIPSPFVPQNNYAVTGNLGLLLRL